MAKWFAVWFGGDYAYSVPDISDRLEEFDSLEEAKAEFANRYHSGRRNTWKWADGTVTHGDTPGVTETCHMDLYAYDPRDRNNGPDKRLTIGPRGGVRVEPA